MQRQKARRRLSSCVGMRSVYVAPTQDYNQATRNHSSHTFSAMGKSVRGAAAPKKINSAETLKTAYVWVCENIIGPLVKCFFPTHSFSAHALACALTAPRYGQIKTRQASQRVVFPRGVHNCQDGSAPFN